MVREVSLLMADVLDKQHKNRMSARNLGIVFGPTLCVVDAPEDCLFAQKLASFLASNAREVFANFEELQRTPSTPAALRETESLSRWKSHKGTVTFQIQSFMGGINGGHVPVICVEMQPQRSGRLSLNALQAAAGTEVLLPDGSSWVQELADAIVHVNSTMQDRKEAQIGKAESNKHIEETGEGLLQPQRARNNHLRQGMITTNSSVEEGKSGDQNLGKGPQIDMNYRKLEEKLKAAEHHITILEKQVTTEKNNSKASAEKIVLTFQEKESRLLQAAAEESQQEIFRIEQKLHSEIHSLEEKIAKLRRERLNEQEASRQTIEASDFRAEQAEKEFRSLVKKHENQLALAQQREKRALQMADDKVAQTMAMLDEREEEISRLKSVMRSLESSVDEHAEGEEEAEQEVVELQTENESLQEHVDDLEAKCSKLKAQVTNLEVEAEKFGGIQVNSMMACKE